jgi:chitinase
MYKRGGLCAPGNIDFSKYTIINYSFFQCDKNGEIFGTDAWGDSILLRGKYDYGNPVQPAYYPNTSLVDLAHVAGAKVMVSIGGWTLSETFPVVAADPVKRANFAHNCVRVLHNYSFDGIDIDWEYPCYTEHKGTPADKQNYTLFMKQIRDSIDAYGKLVNQKMLLTAAYGAPASLNTSIEWENLVPFMDYFNMMTYDFNGGWSEDANHNSPLYAPRSGDTNALSNCQYRLINTYKVPKEKINMGVPFYGRSLIGKPGIKLDLHGKQHTGAIDTITFIPDIGGTLYYNILLQKDKFEEKWDDKSQVPYLVGKGDLNTFVSYDDPKSIKLKAEFVKANELAGVIIWELTGDYTEKAPGSGIVGQTPLIDALNSTLQTARKKPIPRRWRDPVVKVEKEKGWRAKAIKQNLKNIYKKGDTPTSQQ